MDTFSSCALLLSRKTPNDHCSPRPIDGQSDIQTKDTQTNRQTDRQTTSAWLPACLGENDDVGNHNEGHPKNDSQGNDDDDDDDDDNLSQTRWTRHLALSYSTTLPLCSLFTVTFTTLLLSPIERQRDNNYRPRRPCRRRQQQTPNFLHHHQCLPK